MKMRRENGSTITSEEVNFLVFRYLQESGEAGAQLTRKTVVCSTWTS